MSFLKEKIQKDNIYNNYVNKFLHYEKAYQSNFDKKMNNARKIEKLQIDKSDFVSRNNHMKHGEFVTKKRLRLLSTFLMQNKEISELDFLLLLENESLKKYKKDVNVYDNDCIDNNFFSDVLEHGAFYVTERYSHKRFIDKAESEISKKENEL